MGETTAADAHKHAIERFVAPSNVFATVLVTAAGLMGPAFASEPKPPGPALLAVILALGIVHALLGTVGLYWLERRGTQRSLTLHFCVAFFVMTLVVVLSRGGAALVSFSLVSQGVLYLRRRGAILVTAGAFVVVASSFAPHGLPPEFLARALFGWLAGAAFVIVFSYMMLRQHRARREVERLARELAAANDRLRTYARDIEALVSANERNRIAREIHDTVGHCLTVVHVQMQAAEASLDRDPSRARASIVTAQKLVQEGLAEVRRSVAMLRPASSGGQLPAFRPIVGALTKLANETKSDLLTIDLRVEGKPRELAEPVEYTLYRAAQESLTNVLKHAAASNVTIELDYRQSSRVILKVEDDGEGAKDTSRSGGVGLLGLRERAEIVGGRLSVGASSAGGFALEVEVPG